MSFETRLLQAEARNERIVKDASEVVPGNNLAKL